MSFPDHIINIYFCSEDLHAMILTVTGHNGSVEDADGLDSLHLTSSASPRPESGDEFAVQSEHLYAIVTRVCHQNIALKYYFRTVIRS